MGTEGRWSSESNGLSLLWMWGIALTNSQQEDTVHKGREEGTPNCLVPTEVVAKGGIWFIHMYANEYNTPMNLDLNLQIFSLKTFSIF